MTTHTPGTDVEKVIYEVLFTDQKNNLQQYHYLVGDLDEKHSDIYLQLVHELYNIDIRKQFQESSILAAEAADRANVVPHPRIKEFQEDRAPSLEFQQGVDAANCGTMKRANPYFIGDAVQRERDDWNRGWDETTAPIKAECLRLIESPDGGKIFAIRYLRGKLSLPLKEAKDWVEAMEVPPVTPIQIQWRIFDLNLQAMKALEQAIALQTQLRVVGI